MRVQLHAKDGQLDKALAEAAIARTKLRDDERAVALEETIFWLERQRVAGDPRRAGASARTAAGDADALHRAARAALERRLILGTAVGWAEKAVAGLRPRSARARDVGRPPVRDRGRRAGGRGARRGPPDPRGRGGATAPRGQDRTLPRGAARAPARRAQATRGPTPVALPGAAIPRGGGAACPAPPPPAPPRPLPPPPPPPEPAMPETPPRGLRTPTDRPPEPPPSVRCVPSCR